MNQIKKFSEEFFRNLKCDVVWDGDILIVNNVPRSFEDLSGKSAPYRLVFDEVGSSESVVGSRRTDFVGKGSPMLVAMMKFLKGAGKTTLLKIDFEVDAEAEIRKRINFKNCEIVPQSGMTLLAPELEKSYRNDFFTRFSFVTSFNYLNECERVVSEVYVHGGSVVEGDLDGYRVVEGEGLKVDGDSVKKDYEIAKKRSVELVSGKQREIGEILKGKVDIEVDRIREHYDRQLGELGGDLNGRLERMRRLELELRSSGVEKRGILRERLERMRTGLIRAGEDGIRERIVREMEATIQDVRQKFSLNVNRRLVNTTVIYYPVYTFRLCLKSEVGGRSSVVGGKVERCIEVSYNPLTKSFAGLKCEGCGGEIVNLSLCAGGHVTCGECLDVCGECGKRFCVKCLGRSCESCGRKVCVDCAVLCRGCGRYFCGTHVRRDCVSGEERCVLCLRACLRCHGMAEEKFFGEARDGSKVCLKCLGAERRDKVLGKVFGR